MALEVRRAVLKDVPRIQALLHQVEEVHRQGRPDLFLENAVKYTDGQLQVLLADDSRPIFVAVNAMDEVAGYGFCMITDYRGSNYMHPIKELYIDDLCVDETYRRQGVGQAIYDHILSYARKIGCYHLTLNVWACNPAAMHFYAKQGMQMLKTELEVVL